MEKPPCKKCGAPILPLTAERYDGYCVACARSEKPLAKVVAKFNQIMAPFFTWLNGGKPGAGCMLMPMLFATVAGMAFGISIEVNSARNSDNLQTVATDGAEEILNGNVR